MRRTYLTPFIQPVSSSDLQISTESITDDLVDFLKNEDAVIMDEKPKVSSLKPQVPVIIPNAPVIIDKKKGIIFKNDTLCPFEMNMSQKILRVWVRGSIKDASQFATVMNLMSNLSSEFKVLIYIHSPGGSISATVIFLTMWKRCKAKIYTKNIGIAASCGSLLLLFGEKINIDPLSTTMFHNATLMFGDTLPDFINRAKHEEASVLQLFENMISRKILLPEEVKSILESKNDLFLPSNIIKQRLIENNLWFSSIEEEIANEKV